MTKETAVHESAEGGEKNPSAKCSVAYYTTVCQAVGTDQQVWPPFPHHAGIAESILQKMLYYPAPATFLNRKIAEVSYMFLHTLWGREGGRLKVCGFHTEEQNNFKFTLLPNPTHYFWTVTYVSFCLAHAVFGHSLTEPRRTSITMAGVF